MSFRDPWWFAAMLLPFGVWWAARWVSRARMRFPSAIGLESAAHQSHPSRLRIPVILRVIALALVVVALARPQQGLESIRLRAEGIDIVLTVDVSGSMLAEDFTLRGSRRNRLDVVKDVVKEFVEHRPNDRIGLVVFAGRPYTQCPLTMDHGWLLSQLDRVEIGMVEDGTAIGSGIATSLNRLRRSKAKSRIIPPPVASRQEAGSAPEAQARRLATGGGIIVLLTDGVNNAGTVTPEAAAQLAHTLGVRLYAIGAGTKGLAPYPATDVFGRKVYQQVKIEVDDEGLTKIARLAGGQYFRATDTESLRTIYHEIDRMEKTTIEQPQYVSYKEWYPWFVIPAMLLLLGEVLVGATWLRVLP